MKYSVEILKDRAFYCTRYKNHRRGIEVLDRKDTAIVHIEYDNGEKASFEYGYLEAETVYALIRNNKDINLNRTYVKDLKLSELGDEPKKIIGFSAYYAFFDGDTDFSFAEFCDGDVNFSHIIFGNGNVCFYKTNFGEGDVYFHKSNFGKGNVDFNSADFSSGIVDFKFTAFGTGHIDFNGTNFGDGDVLFCGSDFGDGDVYFRKTTFGYGHVDFHGSTFGKGNVYFNNTDFGDGNVDFYHTNFGEGIVDFENTCFGTGKVDFKSSNFEKGDVNFSNSTFSKGFSDFSHIIFGEGSVNFSRTIFEDGNVSFRSTSFCSGNVDFRGAYIKNGCLIFNNTKFGTGDMNFSKINFGNKKADFSDTAFGTGKLTFVNSIARHLIFDNCIFNDYCDMRLAECEYLSLNNCTFKDVFDLMKDDRYEVKIKSMSILNAKNLGQIYLDWDDNSVKSMISNQKHIDENGNSHETNNKQKLEQFRLLKENFRNLGRYEDEDKAYVEFKRYERLEEYNGSRLKIKKKWSKEGFKYYKNRIIKFIIYWLDIIVLDKIGGYGTCPRNIFITMLAAISFFTGIYSLFPSMIDLSVNCRISGAIPRAFYLSVETFLTIGYGNISPANNFAIILSAAEGFMGVFLMSYFTVAFVRKILR